MVLILYYGCITAFFCLSFMVYFLLWCFCGIFVGVLLINGRLWSLFVVFCLVFAFMVSNCLDFCRFLPLFVFALINLSICFLIAIKSQILP